MFLSNFFPYSPDQSKAFQSDEQNAILQDLSGQDACFDSNLKILIDQERKAMNLYDQRDSKGHMPFVSSKGEWCNIQNQLQESHALSVPSNYV